MMKVSTKPISSPGRAEKFPPPLMRFLRTNVGSRSRGRSRSTPIFFRRKIAAVETQEPSSPKVTCMGQVRARRSKRPSRSTGAPATTRRRRKRVRDALFCSSCTGSPSCSSIWPDWSKWVAFFHFGRRRKAEIGTDCLKIEPKSEPETAKSAPEDEDEEEEEEDKVLESSSSNAPPKNALLLTRSRSAPYRSSSLAGKFWGSPARSEQTEKETESPRTEQLNGGEKFVLFVADEQKPTSENEPICRDSDRESRTDPETEEKLGVFEEREEKKEEEEEEGSISKPDATVKSESGDGSVRPLLLKRCKSEPARTAAAKLGTDVNFWKLTRFAGDADSCS